MGEMLPKNWVETALGNILSARKGKKPEVFSEENIEGYLPYILIEQLEGKPYRLYTNDEKVVRIDASEVIIVWDGSIGKCGSGFQGALGSTFVAMKPLVGIPTKFLEYIILRKQNYIKETSTGVGLQHINKNFFKECLINLPPLAEQKRIVSKLDVLFAQHQAMKKALQRIPLLLKDFRQQVLAQAVTGKLVKPKFIGRFEDYSIKIITGPFGSALHQSEYIDNGIPVINPSHIKNGEILPDSKIAIEQDKFDKLKAWHLIQGDIILGRRGEMGRAAFKIGNEKMLCGTGSIILRSKSVNSKFLTYYLRSEFCVNYLINNSVGSTMINLNQSILKNLPIPIYSLDEQQEIVSIVELSFIKADKIEQCYNILKAKISTLPQAILHKAFNGELVEHLPTDGDAKDLLEEIIALKENMKRK